MNAGPRGAALPSASSRLVGDDAQQPGPEAGARTKPIQGVERLDERLLGHVLGLGGVARDERSESNGGGLVAFDEVRIRADVAVVPHAFDEHIVRNVVLHARPTALCRPGGQSRGLRQP